MADSGRWERVVDGENGRWERVVDGIEWYLAESGRWERVVDEREWREWLMREW